MALVEMRISLVTVDPYLDTPVVVLEERDGKRAVPIWIGQAEALAIVTAVRGIPMARPMTHDLFKEALTSLGASVEAVEVIDLKEGTYFARIRLKSASGTTLLDSRPSDAMALAVRTGAPILVAEEVIAQAANVQIDPGSGVAIAGDVSPDLLATLTDEAFPKWKM